MHPRMHIYKQRLLSVRHFFHVELPGSTFPFPPSLHRGLAGMKVFLPFIFFFRLLCMMQIPTADKVCKAVAVSDITVSGCFAAYNGAALFLLLTVQQIWWMLRREDICSKSITCNYITPPNKSGSLSPVGRVDIPIDSLGVCSGRLCADSFPVYFYCAK